jgi:hypothetical protein
MQRTPHHRSFRCLAALATAGLGLGLATAAEAGFAVRETLVDPVADLGILDVASFDPVGEPEPDGRFGQMSFQGDRPNNADEATPDIAFVERIRFGDASDGDASPTPVVDEPAIDSDPEPGDTDAPDAGDSDGDTTGPLVEVDPDADAGGDTGGSAAPSDGDTAAGGGSTGGSAGSGGGGGVVTGPAVIPQPAAVGMGLMMLAGLIARRRR